jgi:hypothetical protein
MGVIAALSCGCGLVGQGRAPRPERALASEGLPDAEPAGAPAREGDEGDHVRAEPSASSAPEVDGEPDLVPETASDEHVDETPGEGPRQAASLDRSGLPVASKYASLDRASCEAELVRRGISFERVGEAVGVVAPLRLTGPLSGVTFRSNLSPKQRRTATIEIYDCRLVLALDDFARILTKRDIVEVVHLSVYRPVSSKVRLKGAGRRHGGALAIDAALFKTKDGRTLSVEKDFHGRIGARPCPAPASASELRKIACEAGDTRLFNVLLTPNYNRAHRNHFHMEVTAGVRWTLIR